MSLALIKTNIFTKIPLSIIQYLYDLTMNFYNDADEIIPNIYLGNHNSALNLNFLKKNDINVIINCTKDKSFITDDVDILPEMYRIPVNDSLLECDFIIMQEQFKNIVPLLLRKYTIEKKNILVHCHMGKQRSAIVVAALLKVLLDNNYLSLDEIPKNITSKKQFGYICNYIVKKRPQAFTFGYRINFKPSYFRFFDIN
jgi:protein tyrosine/serine phosphatase